MDDAAEEPSPSLQPVDAQHAGEESAIEAGAEPQTVEDIGLSLTEKTGCTTESEPALVPAPTPPQTSRLEQISMAVGRDALARTANIHDGKWFNKFTGALLKLNKEHMQLRLSRRSMTQSVFDARVAEIRRRHRLHLCRHL